MLTDRLSGALVTRRPTLFIQRWFLIIILLLAHYLAVSGIDRESLWRDEVDSIRFASDIWHQIDSGQSIRSAMGQLAGYLTKPGWNGPLYFLALEPWLRIAGQSELALRYPSALAAVIAAALIFVLGVRLARVRVGMAAAVLAAVNPYLVWYAGEGKMYTIITALALLSTYLLLRAAACSRKRFWIGYVLVTSSIFYTHILTPLLLPVQALMIILLYPRAIRSPAAWLSAAALTLPYLPLFIWQWPHLVQPAETGFPFVPLGSMLQRIGEVFSRGLIGWDATAPLVLLVGSMVLGVFAGRDRQATAGFSGLALVCWALVPVMELYLVSLRRPLFTERYLIWALPAWLLLASAGLAWLGNRGKGWKILAVAWLAGMVITSLMGIAYQWVTPVRADFRSATELVQSRYAPGEVVLFQIPYLQYTFDYYAPGMDYTAAEGPYTNAGASADEVDAYLRRVTAGTDRIWLVLSEASMWDSRNLTLAWFEEKGELERYGFNRVEVVYWEGT
ncbi:MAG: glycosyltransferase family 39 protein [Anaerolineales bacterium]|nr:glycosyltransferase family 39 protein [Anaerolineales bacterium]